MLKKSSGTTTRKPQAALNPIPRQMLKKVSIRSASGGSLNLGCGTINSELGIEKVRHVGRTSGLPVANPRFRRATRGRHPEMPEPAGRRPAPLAQAGVSNGSPRASHLSLSHFHSAVTMHADD